MDATILGNLEIKLLQVVSRSERHWRLAYDPGTIGQTTYRLVLDEMLTFSPVLCQERKRLLGDYHDAVKSYYEAVQTLVEMISGAVISDLEFLRCNCRDARERAEQVRITLYRHEINHCCDRIDWTG